MIGIVDYGMGNLRSVQKAFEYAGTRAVVLREAPDAAQCSGLVLPGVGAFGRAMENLTRTGMKQAVLDHLQAGKPFLGICLGLQLLFAASEENFGGDSVPGLGIVPGRVRRFGPDLKVPQIGWNQIHARKNDPLLAGIPDGCYVYFVHSYYVEPVDPAWVLTTTDYGPDFVSSISQGPVWGIQFHPEKSSDIGLTILRNFGEIVNDYHSRS